MVILGGLALAVLAAVPAQANLRAVRQYYGGWTYYPERTYYYRSYYYKPFVDYEGYKYHYCIYYPAQPRYVYYYNPYKRVYWGRYDTQAKGGDCYSRLAEKDCKETLKEIPESAFPAPGKMPRIPDARDDVPIEPPPSDLPKD
jgi:hypothetical protein